MSVVSENCTAEMGDLRHRCNRCGDPLAGRNAVTILAGAKAGDYCFDCFPELLDDVPPPGPSWTTRPAPRGICR